jgi:pyruvate/2-oxoglutarate dehydrogenase complex dihydrolipoamide acyltransferase (E2) component
MSAIPWARVSVVPRGGASSSLGHSRSRSRGISGSPKRHAAIMMPAMSPLMAEGTIRRWKKKEGEHFQAGDVLLEIESDIATLDVEACSPGILGKILTPDGTSRVPIEQVIALVARDMDEYALLQSSALHVQDTMLVTQHPRSTQTVSSSFSSSSMSMSNSMRSSSPSRTPRRLSLFEQQMQRGNRHAHAGGPLASPSTPPRPLHSSPSSSMDPSPSAPPRPRRDSFTPVKHDSELLSDAEQAQAQADGVAMRRRIVHNLSTRSLSMARSQSQSKRDDFDAFL